MTTEEYLKAQGIIEAHYTAKRSRLDWSFKKVNWMDYSPTLLVAVIGFTLIMYFPINFDARMLILLIIINLLISINFLLINAQKTYPDNTIILEEINKEEEKLLLELKSYREKKDWSFEDVLRQTRIFDRLV